MPVKVDVNKRQRQRVQLTELVRELVRDRETSTSKASTVLNQWAGSTCDESRDVNVTLLVPLSCDESRDVDVKDVNGVWLAGWLEL